MGEELTPAELAVLHRLLEYTRAVKGTDAMTTRENGECIKLSKDLVQLVKASA